MVLKFQLIIDLMLGYLGLAHFLGSFMEGRYFRKPWNDIQVMLLYLVILRFRKRMTGLWDILYVFDYNVLMDFILIILLFLAVAAFCYKAPPEVLVFTSVTAACILQLSECFAQIVQSELFRAGRLESYLSGKRLGDVEIFICGELPAMLTALAALRGIAWLFQRRRLMIRKTELFFLLIPDLVGLCLVYILNMMWQINEESVFSMAPVLRYVIPLVLLFCIIAIVNTIVLFLNMTALNEARSSRAILERQNNSLQEHIREMERIQFGLRSLRHDMRNTVSLAQKLAEEQKDGGNAVLQSYLSSLSQTMESLELQFRTGNQVVDVLLNMKYHDALRFVPELTIDTECFCLPESLLVQSYDISMILGNALDNAIEACRKLKQMNPDANAFIQLSSLLKGKTLLLEIKNSYDGAVIMEGKNGLPLTIKQDKELHGIGMLNIQRISEKYHGALNWSTDRKRDVFILSIMLKNENPTA